MLAHMDKNETTKARLAKDQVDILEAKFQENQKPNSQTKRLLANDFGVEVARINVCYHLVSLSINGTNMTTELVSKQACESQAGEETSRERQTELG